MNLCDSLTWKIFKTRCWSVPKPSYLNIEKDHQGSQKKKILSCLKTKPPTEKQGQKLPSLSMVYFFSTHYEVYAIIADLVSATSVPCFSVAFSEESWVLSWTSVSILWKLVQLKNSQLYSWWCKFCCYFEGKMSNTQSAVPPLVVV